MATPTQSVLRSEVLRKLEQLQLVIQKRSRSNIRGERQSKARGHSVEFADHRNYSAGDDLRYLDWNLYGRLDRLFVKLYEEEREFPVNLFLDASESMNFGEPLKFEMAAAIAAAVGYVTVASYDRLRFCALPAASVPPSAAGFFRSIRGRGVGLRYLQNLQSIQPGGQGGLVEWLESLLYQPGPRGLAVGISDCLDTRPVGEPLKRACGAGFQVVLVQVLSPQEFDPPFSGELKLVDCESGAHQEITFGKYRLRAYRQMVQGFIDEIADSCRQAGARHVVIRSDSDLDEVLFKTLREKGVIK